MPFRPGAQGPDQDYEEALEDSAALPRACAPASVHTRSSISAATDSGATRFHAAADGGKLLESTASPETSSRAQAPEIAGPTIDGDAVSLASFLGRPVMVNVWSSW